MIMCRSCYAMCNVNQALREARESRLEQLIALHYSPGSVWPFDSLFNKFRRLCYQNKACYSCPAGHHGRPTGLAS